MRKVEVNFLEKVFFRIIEKLKYERVNSVDLEDDLYQKIPTHRWSIYNNPEEVVVIGSLDDDIDSLALLVHDKDRPCTYVDFDRFASVLRAVSEVRNPVDDNLPTKK